MLESLETVALAAGGFTLASFATLAAISPDTTDTTPKLFSFSHESGHAHVTVAWVPAREVFAICSSGLSEHGVLETGAAVFVDPEIGFSHTQSIECGLWTCSLLPRRGAVRRGRRERRRCRLVTDAAGRLRPGS
jgi:hypothetical protein